VAKIPAAFHLLQNEIVRSSKARHGCAATFNLAMQGLPLRLTAMSPAQPAILGDDPRN
jgi:hypothetical protein